MLAIYDIYGKGFSSNISVWFGMKYRRICARELSLKTPLGIGKWQLQRVFSYVGQHGVGVGAMWNH